MRKLVLCVVTVVLTLSLWPAVFGYAGHGGHEEESEAHAEHGRAHGHGHAEKVRENEGERGEGGERGEHGEIGERGEREQREEREELEERRERGEGEEREEAEEAREGRFFDAHRRGLLHSCYASAPAGSLPPGLEKHLERTGHLPPGLEKHLRRTGHLPPGLEKKLHPASAEVVRCFGPLPANTRLFTLGRDAVLLNERAGTIVDLLRNFY